MFQFPPIPDWDALHPLVVHFPIGLLLLAPVFILLALFWKNKSKGLLLSAFILMVFGTISAYVASSTGEAAGELAERTAEVSQALESHEALAESTRTVFTVLTAVFGALLVLPVIMKKQASRKLTVFVGLAFLIVYSFGSLMLANTSHSGGKLVHVYGVHAMIEPGK